MPSILTGHNPSVHQTRPGKTMTTPLSLATGVLTTEGFSAALHCVIQATFGHNPLLSGALMVLILAVFSNPLMAVVQRVWNRLTPGSSYDSSHIIHEYSTSISNILDLELLANVMLSLIGETLRVQHGELFLVDHGGGRNDGSVFRLRQVGSITNVGQSTCTLPPNSPIAGYLRQEKHILTGFDIDLLARFRALSSGERDWLTKVDARVYVPIHAKGEWIGLMTLGPKESSESYSDEDLVLLRTLADQTAIALENARLVADLVHAHDDLGQAYAAVAEANRQLQELDKLKSAFIGVITHELRTPFANISFSIELLERYGRKHLPPDLDDQLAQVADGINVAKRMIDNLVTFATFLSKQGELDKTQLYFCQVVEECMAPLKPLAEAKGIRLHRRMPEGLPQLVGDRDRLGDAVYHLVHNAIKFTGTEGEVWVGCRTNNHSIRFEVQDTGVGVPADKLPALWDGFVQMADPVRRGVEGLGLGLALVKYVVNAHGGDVFGDSEENVGSTFGFEIPLGQTCNSSRTTDQ
jgi:signal transduction histidine kinase